MTDPVVIDALWEQTEPLVYITRADFERALDEWEIEAVTIDEKLAFVALVKGPEFHFTSFDTGHPISMSMIRSRLDAIMDKFSFVLTRTPIEGADRQHRFNRAFGFKETGRSEFFVEYRKERA